MVDSISLVTYFHGEDPKKQVVIRHMPAVDMQFEFLKGHDNTENFGALVKAWSLDLIELRKAQDELAAMRRKWGAAPPAGANPALTPYGFGVNLLADLIDGEKFGMAADCLYSNRKLMLGAYSPSENTCRQVIEAFRCPCDSQAWDKVPGYLRPAAEKLWEAIMEQIERA